MGAKAAKEAVRRWRANGSRMDGEGSGERTRVAREAAPRGQWGNGTCCGDRGNGNDCGMKNGDCTGMVSSISPAARGQNGSEYVSTRTHPLSPQPPHTPNPTLPLGPRGDQSDPRTGLLSGRVDEAEHPVGGRSRDGQKERGQRMGRNENAASRWAQGCMLPWPHCGPKGRGSERGSRPCRGGWHAGRARAFRGAIPAIDPEQLALKHAVHGATSTHCATLRSATAASPVRRRSHTDCRLIAPG